MPRPTHVYVVIPAARPHLALVQECLEVLGPLKASTLVVANGQHPPTELELGVSVLHDRSPDVNISRWWNLGLDQVLEWETNRRGTYSHHVLLLNADARINYKGVAMLSWALDDDPQAILAGPMRATGTRRETRVGPIGLDARVPGWCFLVRGDWTDPEDQPFRADEQFRWWCGDDDMEWRARRDGGTLRVGPIDARHLGDGTPKGPLLGLAQQDLVRFEAKWGIRPW